MRGVNELNENELNELRETYFYQLLDEGDVDGILDDIDEPSEIPMSALVEQYGDVDFVEDDFFCS